MNLINTCSHMDIFDLCDCLDDDSVDMILADLPYGITACEWDNVIPFDDMWECFKRIIKPRGAVVLTASGKFTYKLVMSNFEWFKYEWVWVKNAPSNITMADYQPLRYTEQILLFSNGSNHYYKQPTKRTSKSGILRAKYKIKSGQSNHFKMGSVTKQYSHLSINPKNVLYYNIPPHYAGLSHPTQKPVALFEYLIRTYTQPGEVVFDPCVGSGTTAIAARNTGRNYIVGDSSAEYVQVARDRLDKPYTLPLFDETPTEQEKPEQMTMEL